MIAINLTIDTSRAQTLVAKAGREFPFALSKAVNALRNEAQDELRRFLLVRFTINPGKLQFMQRLIKGTSNATRAKPVAELAIAGPNGNKGARRAELLTRHVEGGVRTKNDPINPFFIPADILRPNDTALPPRSLYPSNLRLQDRKAIEGGTLPAMVKISRGGTVQVANTKLVRNQRTRALEERSFFVIPVKNNLNRTPGIYERIRTGPDKGDLQLLWLYKQRIDLKRPRLPFYDVVNRRVRERWQPLIERELNSVISARTR